MSVSNTSQKITGKNLAYSGRDGTYLPTLDGWRSIAILIVLYGHGVDGITHFFARVGLGTGLDPNSAHQFGLLGVKIFFGISGLLITSRLIADQQKRGKINLRFFYIRRVYRILPASILFLVGVGLLGYMEFINISLGRWLSSLLFFANYSTATGSYYVGHFWSLAVEEHFYLIWPAAFLFLNSNKKRLFFCVCFTVFIALWRAIDFKYRFTWSEGGAGFFWGRTDIVADGLLWGCAFALVYADRVWKKRINNFISLPGVLIFITLTVIMIQVLSFQDWKIRFVLLTIQAACIPIMLLGTIANNSKYPSRILESKIFIWIGRISYSLYLWQQVFLVWTDSVSIKLSFVQTFPINVMFAFLFAYVSYRFIETPLIALGHRITKTTSQ